LTTLLEKLIKIGAKVVRHSRKTVFQMNRSGGSARVVPGHYGRDWAAELARSGNRMKQKVKGLA
jgi:hypothetical protein